MLYSFFHSLLIGMADWLLVELMEFHVLCVEVYVHVNISVVLVMWYKLVLCRRHPAVFDGTRRDWHCMWGAVWKDEGTGTRGSWAHHTASIQCPAKRDADPDLWTSATWIQEGEDIIFCLEICAFYQHNTDCRVLWTLPGLD